MKQMTILFLMLSIFSCQKISQNKIEPNVTIKSTEYVLQDLHKSRMTDFLVVLFKNNLTAKQWEKIFTDTKKLSQNNKILRQIEGLEDEESLNLRISIGSENVELLDKLSADSVYLFNWSFGEERCRFLYNELLNLVCKPGPEYYNPRNGGFPVQDGIISIQNPDPIKDEIKVPYFNFVLSTVEVPRKSIQIRLKLENKSETEFWFKGDVKPLNQNFSETAYDYGYAEMTLSR